MADDWRSIWERKAERLPANRTEMLAVNGFDTAAGRMAEDDFRRIVAGLRHTLRIAPESRVLDVGCGCGAMLDALRPCRGTGIDYSEKMIRIARTKHPNSEFLEAEAAGLETLPGTFEAVYSFGVFCYFPTPEYADRVLDDLASRLPLGGRGMVLDIPDLHRKAACEELRERTIPDYRLNYSHLPHLYLDPDRVIARLERAGCRAERLEHFAVDYGYRDFRFNIFFEKTAA